MKSQYLRPEWAPLAPKTMLDPIHSQTTTGRELIDKWATKFAHAHAFDPARAISASGRTSLNRRLAVLRAPLMNLVERFSVDVSLGLLLADVFDASIAASTIMATRPHQVRSVAGTMRRVALRRLTRLASSDVSPSN